MDPCDIVSPRAGILHEAAWIALKVSAWSLAAVCLIFLICAPGWAGVSELDREEIFCACYSLCGETPGDGDIEDLCWALERPTFSDFKPAEMFSRNSLRGVRRCLEKRIQQMNANTLFRWNMKGHLRRTSGGRARFQPVTWKPDFPQATPYIGAEMPPRQWRRLRKALKDFPLDVPEEVSGKAAQIGVLLKALRVDKRFQTRNIAREDVSLPIRCVVFVPVAIHPPPGLSERVISIPR